MRKRNTGESPGADTTVVDTDGEGVAAGVDEGLVVLDVRPAIDRGEEPFATIMAAVADLGDDDLVVVAPFEPTPLEGVLSSQGFSYAVTQVSDTEWRVRFHQEA